MATIKSPHLFFVTSPRTPQKMRPEVALLTREFAGARWNRNRELQSAFMQKLSQLAEFEGAANPKDPALSARDRITRGPKSLGLVALDKIALTPAGAAFLDDTLFGEALLRQLLKFQLPSPFHRAGKNVKGVFWVRPYLEILRLVDALGRLAFDELTLYAMQLTDYRRFEETVEAVRDFRIRKERARGRYRQFIDRERKRVIELVFKDDIAHGRIKTRESAERSLTKFIKTKSANFRDYADACLRYLRATGLVTISNPGRTITIIEARREEVDFILANTPRDPVFVDDEKLYTEQLFDDTTPALLTDDRAKLEEAATAIGIVPSSAHGRTLDAKELKKRIADARERVRRSVVDAQVTELKTFAHYQEVLDVFDGIARKSVYDPPLALEWNVWRAMNMLDGGRIAANLKFDDAGNPLSTAPGNAADIVCDYGDFLVAVEVTLASGARQYETEGEPVARHLGELKSRTGKEVYCLFVAPKINESVRAHFFALHKVNIRYYGGSSVIVPVELEKFIGMLRQSKECGYVPQPDKVRAFCESSRTIAQTAADESEWYEALCRKAERWLE